MYLTIYALIAATIFLAYSNGANDNFKGVATLFGSDTTDYKKALWWATATTFAGSVSSIFIASALVKSFSGKGVVPENLAGTTEFLIPVALGAGLTVILATFTGFPISTTHSLTGALVGAGLVAVGSQVNFGILATKFFAPLLVSPILAVFLSGSSYLGFRRLRLKMGIGKESCICVTERSGVLVPAPQGGTAAFQGIGVPEVVVDKQQNCAMEYSGTIIGISAQTLLDFMHFLSAGVVSFARGLNDTPKIVALIFILQAFDVKFGMMVVAVAIAIGGLINARKVAMTISKKITAMNHGQGFTANLVTGILVIFASRLGMPVSTTHVSVGSLFGIGLVTKEGNKSVIGQVLASWLLTLPVAALTSGLLYWLIN